MDGISLVARAIYPVNRVGEHAGYVDIRQGLHYETANSVALPRADGLDLNDPNADGKLRIDEINAWKSVPLCLFTIYGEMEFFIKLYVEIDLGFFEHRSEWEPYRTKPPIPITQLLGGDNQPTRRVYCIRTISE